MKEIKINYKQIKENNKFLKIKKYQRCETYKRYVESYKMFLKFIKKYNNKTIIYKRSNQSLLKLNYSHATAIGTPPAFWNICIELNQIKLKANYRNIDTWSVKKDLL